jgi:transcriptional regulator with XRE-family HTH domain
MEIANRIRNIRESYGLTQADVAYKANITPQAYGKIERRAGKTKIETLIKIANAIGVSIKFLIDIENPLYIEQKNNP